MTTDLAAYQSPATVQVQQASNSIFGSKERFEFSLRVAQMLSKCDMIPKHFSAEGKGPDRAIANCMIAIDFAGSVGANIFMAMKSMYEVYGNIGIDAKLLIAMLNQSGKFSVLKYKFIGDVKGQKDNAGCIAYATEVKSGETVEGPMVDWKMVKEEGWIGKKGSKWATMPDMMFRYRAATLFIRLYAPELTFGMHTTEELVDMHQSESGQYDVKEKQVSDVYNKVRETTEAAMEKEVSESNKPESKSEPPQASRNNDRNPPSDNRPPEGKNLNGDPAPQGKTKFGEILNIFGNEAVKTACKRLGLQFPIRDQNNQSVVDRVGRECEAMVYAESEQ